MTTDLDVGSWTKESSWTESHESTSHRAESPGGESAQALHARVVRYCHDSLTRALVELHRPQGEPGADPELPTCHGCARYDAGDAPAAWPCRPYGLIASTVLPDVVLVDEFQNA